MMQYLTGGADLTAIALFINRIALGAFFTISGFHKLFNRQRHAVFVRELVTDRVPRLGFNQWFVPSIEFFGGLALLTGMLAPLAALGLLVICLVAVHTSGKRRVISSLPIDRADYLDDVLYLPEVLYLVMLVVVVLATVDDVAETALFLASFGLNALTGQSIVVSHGWFMQ